MRISSKKPFDVAAAIAELPFESRVVLLRRAVSEDNAEALKTILGSGTFGVKLVSDALHLAATHGCPKAARVLLAHARIAVNFHGDDGYTPLMRASYNNHREIVDMLLARSDIDINASAAQREHTTAATLAESAYLKDIVKILMDDPRFDKAAHKAHVKANEASLRRNLSGHEERQKEEDARAGKMLTISRALGLPDPGPLGG